MAGHSPIQKFRFISPRPAQGGGSDPSDKWIDVVVNIGPFPENLPPVLSLSASALTIAPGHGGLYG